MDMPGGEVDKALLIFYVWAKGISKRDISILFHILFLRRKLIILAQAK
jgi:hypothetical protein